MKLSNRILINKIIIKLKGEEGKRNTEDTSLFITTQVKKIYNQFKTALNLILLMKTKILFIITNQVKIPYKIYKLLTIIFVGKVVTKKYITLE